MTTGVPSVFNGSNGVVYEGNSCISDTFGNLLFYCNGDTIWNKNHQPMLNGTGMPSDKVTTLNSCIIPRPGNPNQYFIFINECVNNNSSGGKLKYSIIDMTLDGGNGAVVVGQKNIPVFHHSTSSISFTKHSNGIDYWFAYSEGIPPYNLCMVPVNNSGPDTTNRIISVYNGPISFTRFSPNSTLFGSSSYEVFQFNNSTGILSNKINLPNDSLVNYYTSYSFEFSPDSKKIYFGLYNGWVYNCLFQQFDLSVFNQTVVANSIYNFYDSYSYYSFRGVGHLQLGPNGKIYIARTGSYSDSLHIIHNPNGNGAACNFQFNALALGTPCNFSLPIYPDYYFNNIPLLTNTNDFNISNSNNVIIYPNPSNEWINLSHNFTDNYQYILVSQLGSVIGNYNGNQLNSKLNVINIPNGIYFLLVKGSSGSIAKKIIINH